LGAGGRAPTPQPPIPNPQSPIPNFYNNIIQLSEDKIILLNN